MKPLRLIYTPRPCHACGKKTAPLLEIVFSLYKKNDSDQTQKVIRLCKGCVRILSAELEAPEPSLLS